MVKTTFTAQRRTSDGAIISHGYRLVSLGVSDSGKCEQVQEKLDVISECCAM